ncbi:hypothetical protein SAMN05878443_0307 [Carnobacterium alterfunditum]|uniref:Uncharacterized protein n=1 Tax=Carnobacterium alterfunditum TaxID=28230 RepID=A0A1N6F020_9LACT|nr:hypothetical protein [Carnobacterium alterfunditum]SIN88586.1 hypothetical protein SAMN05878443_0307 [Carnobacterium alterfunditum]
MGFAEILTISERTHIELTKKGRTFDINNKKAFYKEINQLVMAEWDKQSKENKMKKEKMKIIDTEIESEINIFEVDGIMER